ncbi:MAG: FAD-dependent oxidoreductase, partial [Spirochaetia bacterium]
MAERFEVVVIGAGPAGIAAAIGARSAGAARVLLVDRDRWLGGILKQCVHAGFGAFNFDAELTGPEYAERYIRQLEGSGVMLALQTSVVSAGRDGMLALSSSARGLWTVRPAAIVLAMGCREKTRGNARIPGTRPAGIFTAGTAQRLINVDGLMVGRDVVVVGSGDVGLIMARRCTLEGARVHAVIERLPYPGGCGRNVVQCLEDFGIPLYLGHAITAIHGEQRVEGVEFAPTAGDQEERESLRLECDTLLFSVGLTPEIELVRQLDLPLDPRTGGPVVDSNMHTLRDGIFACGNLVQAYDIADWVSNDGERAGRSAARFAGGARPARGGVRLLPGTGVRSVVPQILGESGEDSEMSIYCRVDARYKAPRFILSCRGRVLGVIEKNFAVPSEMVALDRAAL